MIKGGSEFLNCTLGCVFNTFLFWIDECSRGTVLNCRQTSLLHIPKHILKKYTI